MTVSGAYLIFVLTLNSQLLGESTDANPTQRVRYKIERRELFSLGSDCREQFSSCIKIGEINHFD